MVPSSPEFLSKRPDVRCGHSSRESPMKRCLILLCAAGLLTGCASRYDIKTTGGTDFTNVSKPKLIPGTRMYVFKDVQGREHYLPELRVREISIR